MTAARLDAIAEEEKAKVRQAYRDLNDEQFEHYLHNALYRMLNVGQSNPDVI